MTAAAGRRKSRHRARIVIVTGLSGSGKSTATKVFEDLGFFCVDNVPPVLLPRIIDLVSEARGETARIALVGDVRGREFLPGFAREIGALRRRRHDLHVLFFDAKDEVLLRRYSETRRKHPLAGRGGAPEGIRRERELLRALRDMADTVIDTSSSTVHDLRSDLVRRFRGREEGGLSVGIVSFGYRHGIPPEADMVIDVRFLPNPNFVPSLKNLTGRDRRVRDYIMEFPVSRRFFRMMAAMLNFLLPLYTKEGKSYFTLGVGCTGGRHRSVAMAEALAKVIAGRGVRPAVVHRDLSRPALPGRSSP